MHAPRDVRPMSARHAANSRPFATGCATRCRASRAAGLYFGHGRHNAYDEAAYLVLHTLSLPLDRLEPFLDARLTHAERGQVLHVIERRVDERIPGRLSHARSLAGRASASMSTSA